MGIVQTLLSAALIVLQFIEWLVFVWVIISWLILLAAQT